MHSAGTGEIYRGRCPGNFYDIYQQKVSAERNEDDLHSKKKYMNKKCPCIQMESTRSFATLC